MAMTAYKASNYDFHEETLHDIVPEVTNDTTRTVLHNELVMLDGFFGEVADYDGIGTGLVGNININSERKIRTSQVKAGLDTAVFVEGATLYFVPQTDAVAGFLTNEYEAGAVAVGLVTDADAKSKWVEFRPFVQTLDISMLRDARGVITGLASSIAHNPVKTVQFVVPQESHSGLAFTNAALGLGVGDKIVDILVKGTALSATGTLTVSHTGGADISSAIACAAVNAVGRTASLAGEVLTAAGLTATTKATGDEGIVTIMYIPA